MGSEQTSDRGDLLAVLGATADRLEKLAADYFATRSFRKRGGYLKLLVNETAAATAIRTEILRPLLRKLRAEEYLQRFEEARRRQLDLLSQLDELSIGVGPADIHQHRPDEAVKLMSLLRAELLAYHEFESKELLPLLESRLNAPQLIELGQKARRARKHAPTHAHPHLPAADKRTALGNMVLSRYDRLRDAPSHPKQTIEAGGEEGP